MTDFNKKRKTQKEQSESKATHALQRRLYKGRGKSYLAYQPPDIDIKADGTRTIVSKTGGYAYWQFEKDLERAAKSHYHRSQLKRDPDAIIDYLDPLWSHQKGYWRGLVIDEETQYLPYIAIDLDRHFADIKAKQFLIDCITTDQIARKYCEQYGLFLSYEVNPDNGSAKWFMWSKNKHLSANYAAKIAEDLHKTIEKATGKNIEVFGYNCKALKLPLHPQKHTIIDTGHVANVARKYKGKSEHNYNQWHIFETHSVIEFNRFLNRCTNADKFAFFAAIKEGCSNLPDVDLSKVTVIDDTDVVTGPLVSRSAPANAGLGDKPPKHFKNASQRFMSVNYADLKDIPNSRERQHKALLRACQSAKRVLTATEAVDLIHEHQLYTGSKNNPVRANRIKGILRYISKTFDPALCKGSGKTFKIDVSKFRKFAKETIPAPIKKVTRRGRVEESGEIISYKKSHIITSDDFAGYLAINEFCRKSAQYKDGGCPEARAEQVHNIMHEAGQLSKKWDVKRWRYMRDIANDKNIVICDYVADTDKAYCYQEGKYYLQTPTWERISKTGLPVDIVAEAVTASIKKQRHNTVGVCETPKISLCPDDIRGKPPDL
jgi:hypothetical protein